MKIQVVFSFQVPVEFKKTKRGYIASCAALDVHSQGGNKRECVENIKEALALFLMSCFQRGTLDKVLTDCGFNPLVRKSAGPQKHKTSGKRYQKINVPLPFQITPPIPTLRRNNHCPA